MYNHFSKSLLRSTFITFNLLMVFVFVATIDGQAFNRLSQQSTSISDTNTPPLQIDVQKKVLENGVTVLVWERPSAGRIGTRMFYKVDVAAERPGTVGLTHMLEHFLFKGSDIAGTSNWDEEYPTARLVETLAREVIDEENRNWDCLLQREVFEELENSCSVSKLDSLRLELVRATEIQNAFAHTTWYDWAVQSAGGTNSTASTGRDWMKFDIDLPANKLELFMWTERSRIEHPVFRHFEPEKEVVVDQIRRSDNRPDGKFSRVMRSLTYDAHPYGWAHWFSDLTQATREDHWEIFHKYFIPQNAVIVVVGDIKAESVFEMAEKYWGSWERGRPAPRLRTVEPQPVGQKRLIVETGAGPAVNINVSMPAVGHADTHVFELLSEIISGSNGRLAQELITNRKIATDVGASGWASKYPSHFEIRVDGRSNNDLDAIEKGINDVLDEIRNGKISDSEIQAAASRLILNLARSLNEIGRSAVTIGGMESIYGWEMLNKLPGLWSGVTADDLNRVISRYFASDVQIVGHLRRESSNQSAISSTQNATDSNNRNNSVTDFVENEMPVTKSGNDDPLDPFDTNLNNQSESASALDQVRPGTWTYGGPIGEFFLNPAQKGVTKIAKSEYTPSQNSENESVAWVNPLSDSMLNDPSPLAIGEQPWYTPPWMAVRRKSGFSAPAPTLDYRDMTFEAVTFKGPNSSQFESGLDNGFTSFINPDPLLPLVQLTLYVDASSTSDPVGKEGISALTADLIRKATKSASSDEIELKLNELGASLTVNSNRNYTRFSALGPASSASEIIQLLSQMIGEPDFEAHFTIEQNRHAIRADRLMDNAASKSEFLFENTLYGNDHPFGKRPSSSSIKNITLNEIQEFHRLNYTPTSMTLAISGDIDRNLVKKAIAGSFGLLEKDENQVNQISEDETNFITRETMISDDESSVVIPPKGIKLITHDLDIRQGLVMMGHLGIQGQPEDHAAIEVMHHILVGGGFVSRMMELLRTQTGITSAVYGKIEPGRDEINPYVFRFGGNPESIAHGIYLAHQEIRKMHEHGLTQEEFESARTAFADGLIPASYDTSHKIVERLAQKQLFGLYDYQSPQYLNYYAGDNVDLDAINSLTLDDVNKAARKYLDPENMIITLVGPLDWIKSSASDGSKYIFD
jgi:predicted Zn-dependent peptidase